MTRGICIPGESASKGGLHSGGLHKWGLGNTQVCLQWGCLHPGGTGGRLSRSPEIHGILRHTINRRAVRILLQCFLVFHWNLTSTIVFNSDVSYRASKRQPHQGFHAVRGKRLNLPNFPSIKRPSSLDFPVSRRDPPIRGFSAVRGKKWRYINASFVYI